MYNNCPLCKNGVEDKYHFLITCSSQPASLNNIRNTIFANIYSTLYLSIFLCPD